MILARFCSASELICPQDCAADYFFFLIYDKIPNKYFCQGMVHIFLLKKPLYTSELC